QSPRVTRGGPADRPGRGPPRRIAVALRLRPLALEDCESLRSWISSADALFQWSGPWDFRWPIDRLQLRRDLRRAGDHRRLYVAVDTGDEPVGHAMLTVQPQHRLGVIGRVLIDPAR